MEAKRTLSLAGIALAVMAFVAGDARAQTWKTTMQLAADITKASCPKSAASYEFTVAGAELIVKTPAGQSHRGAIGSDGKVAIVFKSPFASLGTVTISGNAPTRDLSINFSAQAECNYRLVPTTEAAAEGGDHWATGSWTGLGISQNQAGSSPVVFQIVLIVSVSGDRATCAWVLLTPKCELKGDHLLIESVGEKELEMKNIDIVRGNAGALTGTARASDPNLRIRFELKRT